MSWNTPLGKRTLRGIERVLVKRAIRQMASAIFDNPIEDSLGTGIAVFDALPGAQQLVMLDYARKYLLEKTPKSNATSAVIDGTVGAIIEFIGDQIYLELELENEHALGNYDHKPPTRWRKLMNKAIKTFGWDQALDPEMETEESEDWEFAIERLHDRILHDDDYKMDFSDHEPDATNALNLVLGISRDYFAAVPLPEPDGPEMLEVIRRLVAY